MSFAEARRFMQGGGHPMMTQSGEAKERSGVLGQDVYDLPPSVVG